MLRKAGSFGAAVLLAFGATAAGMQTAFAKDSTAEPQAVEIAPAPPVEPVETATPVEPVETAPPVEPVETETAPAPAARTEATAPDQAEAKVADKSLIVITSHTPGAPTAVDDSYNTPFDTALVIAPPNGVLDNDVGAAGEIVLTQMDGVPANGTLSDINGFWGSFVYTPNSGFTGIDTFTYEAYNQSDRTVVSHRATVSIAVGSAPIGPPAATGDNVDTPMNNFANIDVLANDTGDAISISSADVPDHGTSTILGGTSIVYFPSAGFTGYDHFDYEITDSSGRTSTARVTVLVRPDLPVALDDEANTTIATAVTIPTLANDSGERIYVWTVRDPANGSATIAADRQSIIYTPDPGFEGTEIFGYTVGDPAMQSDDAIVTVTVVAAAVDPVDPDPDPDPGDDPIGTDDSTPRSTGPLPDTGAPAMWLTLSGPVLLAMGVGLLWSRRRLRPLE